MILNFPFEQFFTFVFGFLLLSVSIFLFEKEKIKYSILFLFLGSFALAYFMIHLDPFLILWDEQYHALVAKNMSEHPFKPMLYKNPILGYDYNDWSNNHIWLHKQPLFLWQMAASIKLFGTTEFAVRFPSMMMHAIMSLFIYKIGKLIANERIGFYGALFFASAYYPLEMAAGKYASDHNDTAFTFYVTASFWAWFEYQSSQKKYWIIVIGVCSGFAVLVKWLPGLLIYLAWFACIVYSNQTRKSLNSYIPFLKSIAISVLVFIPWQVYKSIRFPIESSIEFEGYSRHFFEPLDGHGGNAWFHFHSLKTLYGQGDLVPYLIVFGFAILFFKKINTPIFKIVVLISVVSVYTFFTIAKTKMPAYCFIVSPFIFLGLSTLYDVSFNAISKKIKIKLRAKFLNGILLMLICFSLIDFSEIRHYHTNWKPQDNKNRNLELKQMEIIKNIQQLIPDDRFVVFNSSVRLNGHIPIMFYTNNIAYNFIPDESQIKFVKEKGYNVAVLNIGILPNYIMQDTSIIKINI